MAQQLERPLPYIQLEIQRFAADTLGMTLEQTGAFILLLCYGWHRGDLPKDIEELARIMHVDTSYAQGLWITLSGFFVPTEDGERLHYPHYTKNRVKALSTRQGRSEGGKNSWAARGAEEPGGSRAGSGATPPAHKRAGSRARKRAVTGARLTSIGLESESLGSSGEGGSQGGVRLIAESRSKIGPASWPIDVADLERRPGVWEEARTKLRRKMTTIEYSQFLKPLTYAGELRDKHVAGCGVVLECAREWIDKKGRSHPRKATTVQKHVGVPILKALKEIDTTISSVTIAHREETP